MGVTDSWLSYRAFVDEQERERNAVGGGSKRHPHWNMGVVEFAELLAAEILRHHLKMAARSSNYSMDLLTSDEEEDHLTSPTPDSSGETSSTELDSKKVIGAGKGHLSRWSLGHQKGVASNTRTNKMKEVSMNGSAHSILSVTLDEQATSGSHTMQTRSST